MKAYVLMNVRTGRSREAVDKIRQVKGIKSVDLCWGRPDAFALVDVPDAKALAETVLQKIQAVDGVESTDTHIVIE